MSEWRCKRSFYGRWGSGSKGKRVKRAFWGGIYLSFSPNKHCPSLHRVHDAGIVFYRLLCCCFHCLPTLSGVMGLLWRHSVLVFFPDAMIKYPNKIILREMMFICLTIPSYSPSLQVSQLVTTSLQSRAESKELMCASGVQLAFSTPTNIRIPCLWNDTTHIGLGFPISINEIKIIYQRHTLQANII